MNDFLSDYSIKETIGKGTFSIVKLGINKKTQEKVAIKILKKKKITRKEDIERIEREINILKKLDHINVIKIYKINEDEEKYYIVMEFCENGELFHYIVERQRLNEEEASFFFYQLINGLEYIHSENIVHRDLKPENLLLGKDYILKIIDFGLSNFCEPDNFLETPCGSPCYASPEMVCGDKYNGHMIDIWSTGIILFAMTCGYLPFEDPDNDMLFKKILKCKIQYPEYLSDMTTDLMKKILVVDPNKRITIQEIKQHPFYLKGKMIFAEKHYDLIKEVEKTSYKMIKIIKNISNNNEEGINNLATSRGMEDNSNEEIFNISTKNDNYNYNSERNIYNNNFDEYFTKHLRKKSEEVYSKKIKESIKDKKDNSKKEEKKDNNCYKKIEIANKNKESITDRINNNKNTDLNNKIKKKIYYFNKLVAGENNSKEKNNLQSSADNKNNIHECETGVANLNLNSDIKNDFSLLQKLLNNNNIYEHGKYFNNKIFLSMKNKKKITYNGNKQKKIRNEKNLNSSDNNLNCKTEYETNKNEHNNLSHSFEKNIISVKIRQRIIYNLASINLKKNKINNKKNNKKEETKNNSCDKNAKKALGKSIKKSSNLSGKNNSIKNNNNLIEKYIINFAIKKNNKFSKNFLSPNNITNNINIIKSPLKSLNKGEIILSNQYRLKSNDNNLDFSTSLNNINKTNNINKFKQMQLSSVTNNNNVNIGTSMSYNLDNTNTKIFLSNNEISLNTNLNNTNKNNDFFNHKKLLISNLSKKKISPECSKINNYIKNSSGHFFKIKKTVISKKSNNNNKEINSQKNIFSILSPNISRIICKNKPQINSSKKRVKSLNKEKRIPLIEINYKKLNTIKKNLLILNKKNNNLINSSVDKKSVKKDKDVSRKLFSNRLNFKKINSSKFIRKKDNNISNIFKIKKLNNQNKSSSGNITERRLNSGNKKLTYHNNKFLSKNITDSILINSFIKYKNIQSKMKNKKNYN